MIKAFGAQAPVFQFTLTCSHRSIFVSSIGVTTPSVALNPLIAIECLPSAEHKSEKLGGGFPNRRC